MDIDLTFKDVAIELIDNVFPTAIKYLQTGQPGYDPATGQVTPNVTEYDINAGVLSSGLNEGGGADGEFELRLWIHHNPTGMPLQCRRPLTACSTKHLLEGDHRRPPIPLVKGADR